jgi:hypothetical protein
MASTDPWPVSWPPRPLSKPTGRLRVDIYCVLWAHGDGPCRLIPGRGPANNPLSMFGKVRFPLRLAGLAVAALLACVGMTAVELALSVPAQAQFGRQGQPGIGGFFQQLFGPIVRPPRQHQSTRPRTRPSYNSESAPQGVDRSRAPPPPKRDEEDGAPTTSIVVMGDSMADWLAYGLEDAFSEAPEVAVVRENERDSGLIRFDRKSDIDWWHHAREILAKEKADYVVMMLGIHDRQNIRERDVIEQAEKEAEEKKKQEEAAVQRALENAPGGPAGTEQQNAGGQEKASESGQKKIAAPEPKKRKSSNAVFEFRSEQWEKTYLRRIDRTIAALKSKGVPVFWVGLPSIRGTRSTADAVYLNDLFRARAERAGIVYVDVWDGFVAESGKYSSYGPDVGGQPRRLRSSDGVFFTRHGARKLAHYVEREIRRFMNNRTVPVALPTVPLGPLPDGKSGVRPVAGPVIPLTVTPLASEVLAGAPGLHRVHGDTLAADALVRGDPLNAPPGRADDFAWPPGSGANRPPPPPADQQPAQPKASGVRDVTPMATVPQASSSIAPVAVPAATAVSPAAHGSTPGGGEDAATTRDAATRPASAEADDAATRRRVEARPPQPVQTSAPRPARRANSPLDALFGRNGLFGWIPR